MRWELICSIIFSICLYAIMAGGREGILSDESRLTAGACVRY
jgi:hypothetical protein